MSAIYLARHSSTSWASWQPRSFSVSLRNVRMIGRCFLSTEVTKLGVLRSRLTKRLTVTELITQYDELRQINEICEPRKSTRLMDEGSRIHNILEGNMSTNRLIPEVTDDRILEAIGFTNDGIDTGQYTVVNLENVVRVLGFVDKLKILATNASPVNENGAIRELYLRGMFKGRIVRGVIDGLHVGPHGIVITETKTTRNLEVSGAALRLAYHQAIVYYRMIEILLNKEDPTLYVAKSFGFEQSDQIAEPLRDSLNNVVGILRKTGMAPYIYLEFMKYRRREHYEVEVFEIKFDREICDAVISARLSLLCGKREPYGFRQSEIPQDIEIIDDIKDIKDFCPAEISGLNLESLDQM